MVLDVDDTLCLTEAACFELENSVLQSMGRSPMTREVHQASWGLPLHEAIALRSPGIDLTAFAAAYEPLLAEAVRDGRLDVIADENLAAIDRLVAAGLQVMLLTSRTLTEVAHFLADDHALADRVTAVFHADNISHLKPDPRAFDALFAAHEIEPSGCVYVGDSPGDAAASIGAGMRFIACLQSAVRTRDDFAPYRVDAFVDTFPDIVDVVDGWRRHTPPGNAIRPGGG